MEEPQGDYLTRPETCLWVFGDVVQVRIDLTEESDDTIDCGHRLLRARQGFTLPASVEHVYDGCNVAIRFSVYPRLTPSVHSRPVSGDASMLVQPGRKKFSVYIGPIQGRLAQPFEPS